MSDRGVAIATALTGIIMLAALAVSMTPAPHSAAAATPTPAATATSTPPAAPGTPVARLYELVSLINAHDFATLYAALTPEVQQQFTLHDLEETIANIEAGAGAQLHITIVSIDNVQQDAGEAEVELTLRIQLGAAADVTLRDLAILVRINDEWRLADHFVQSALTAIGLVRPGPLSRSFDADGCLSGDVLAGVYAPGRLQVLDRCRSASGIVHSIEHSLDGDMSFNLRLAPADEYLLNDGNRRNQDGMLVVEIIPGDQDRVAAPHEGEEVRVTGAWVLDTVHGWNEIHPVWRIDAATAAATPVAATTASPAGVRLPSTGTAGAGDDTPTAELTAASGLGLLLIAAGWRWRRRGVPLTTPARRR